MILLFVYLLITFSDAKVFKQSIHLKNLAKWNYLTKWGGDIGTTNYEITLWVTGGEDSSDQGKIGLRVFLDDKWEDALKKQDCERNEFAAANELISVNSKGGFHIYKGSLRMFVKRHVWFFVLDDCENQFHEAMSEKNLILNVEIHILNADDSEFTSEENGIMPILLILFLVNIGFLLKTTLVLNKDYKSNEEWDSALLFLLSAMIMETLHNTFYLIHYQKYSQDGIGIVGLATLADIFETISSFQVTVILVLLSTGWLTKFKKILHQDSFITLSVLVGIIQMVIVGMGKLSDDQHHKYHKYEGWIGYVIICIQLGLYVYFMMNMLQIHKQSSNNQIKQFTITLGLYGSLYLISFPTFIIISNFIAPYVRQKVIVYGTSLTRTIAMGLLLGMFSSKRSVYYQISIKNQSFLDCGKLE